MMSIQSIRCFLVAATIMFGAVAEGHDVWFGDQQGLWRVSQGGVEVLGALPADVKSIARDANGEGWIALAESNTVIHMDASGAILASIDTTVGVQSLAIDIHGNVWGTRPGMDDVIKIDPVSGNWVSHPVGSVPYGIAIDTQGRICVTCSYGNVVQILSSDGELVHEIPVGFFPTGIAAAHDGGLWVAEKEGLRKLDSLGQSTWNDTVGIFPIGVTTDLSGRAWFSCQNSHQVVVVGENGVENIIDVPERPLGISGNGDGSVTVLCRNGGAIVRLSSSGDTLGLDVASYPLGTGDLTGLQRLLVVDPAGDFDGDGVSNVNEAHLGFDPFNPSSCPMTFVRGDMDMDGIVDFADGIQALLVLFAGQSTNCLESLDVDDDGKLTLSDPIRILSHVLDAGPAPESPYPEFGPDLDPDEGFPCFP